MRTGRIVFGPNTQNLRSCCAQSGNLLFCGRATNANGVSGFALARTSVNGDLDPSFGTNGIALPIFRPMATQEECQRVYVQSDGSIVAGGLSNESGASYAVACRLQPNGALDETYGVSGKFCVQMNAVHFAGLPCVLQDSQNRLILAGNDNTKAWMCRVTPAGVLDASFGTNGVVTNGTIGRFVGIIAQSDGKIVLASDLSILRYNTDGILDGLFGVAGAAAMPVFPGLVGPVYHDVTIQSTGNILGFGYGPDANGAYHLGGARYTTDGVLDPTYGTAGLVDILLSYSGGFITTRVLDQPNSIEEDATLIVGNTMSNGLLGLGVVKLLSNGILDTRWGSDGCLQVNVGSAGSVERMVQVGNRLIINCNRRVAGLPRWCPASVTVYGDNDSSFGDQT